jgi:HEAT repeat protein
MTSAVVGFVGLVCLAGPALGPADLIAGLRSTDPAERLRAVQQVEHLGADGGPAEVYLAPLAKLLADADPQTRGLAALGMWRHVPACKGKVPEGVVAPLLLGWRDGGWHLSTYCDRVLLSLSDRALPQLREAVSARHPLPLRLAAIECGWRLVVFPACREEVEEMFWTGLTDPDSGVRDRARVLLTSLREDYERPPFRDTALLAKALHSEDVRVRDLAFQQLEDLDQDVYPLLIDLLDEKSPFPRAQVTSLLSRSLERLMTYGQGPDREEIQLLLSRLDRKDSSDEENTDRKSIYQEESVRRILDRHETRLAQEQPRALVAEAILFSNDPKVQVAVLDELRLLYSSCRVTPTPWALNRLVEILRSRKPEPAQKVAFLLRYTLRPKVQVPGAVLDTARAGIIDGDRTLQVGCSYVLAACGRQAEETLLALLQEKDVEVQYAAVQAVTAMLERHHVAILRAEPHLKRLLDSPDESVRRSATDALKALQPYLRGGKP